MKADDQAKKTSGKFRHIRGMILRRVLLVPFIIVMLVYGTLVYFFAANIRDQAASELARIAREQSRLIYEFLEERASDLEFAASSQTFDQMIDDGYLVKALEQLQAGSPAFLDLGVFDEAGNHVAYVGPYNLKGKNYSDAEWFKEVQDKKIYISDVFLGYRKIPHFIIAVRSGEGGRRWYLRATIDTQYFNNLVESVRMGKTGEAFLINESGMFQTRRRSGGELMEVDRDHALYKSDGASIVPFAAASRTGVRYLYATGRLSDTGWLLVVRQEIADAYAPLVRAVVAALAIIFAGGAVVVGMGFVLASGLSHRLAVADMEKQQMGSQLIMAGKLAEAGEMSAGVAHEINNPLQVMSVEHTLITDILGDIEKSGGAPGPETMAQLRDSVNQIAVQIDRCRNITMGLLKFARKSDTTMQEADLRAVVREAVGMIERRAQLEGVRIIQVFESDLPRIVTDTSQLHQVFLNLLNNTLYAFRERDNGEIRISGGVEDDFAVVSVADNGCGISPENMEKIFLPFFTTKPVGQGTGLGLSTCYGIVERLGGQIKASSKLGAGSVFSVFLPLTSPAGNENKSLDRAIKTGGEK